MFKNLKFYKSYEDIVHNTLVILLPRGKYCTTRTSYMIHPIIHTAFFCYLLFEAFQDQPTQVVNR